MRKEIVVWGTGNVTKELLRKYNSSMEISFFIDNDVRKKGKFFEEKRIVTPEEIKNWKGLFIIISTIAYRQVEKQIISYGMKKDVDYAFYFEYSDNLDFNDIEDKMNQSLEQIQTRIELYKHKVICFNDAAVKVENEKNFYRELDRISEDFKLVFAVGGMNSEIKEESYMPIIKMPSIFSYAYYGRGTDRCEIPDTIIKEVESVDYLQKAARNLRLKTPDMKYNYEYGLVYYYCKYVEKLLLLTNPKGVMVRNSFAALNFIVENVASKLKLRIIHAEVGVIPGTLTFDLGGEMGKSYPAIYAEEFKNLEVTDKEIEYANQVCEYISNTDVNRRVQLKLDLSERVIEKLKPNRPIILCAGQYDFSSGIQPYDEQSKLYHSPIFQSSIEAARYLAELAAKNDWNFIYKPHPVMNAMNEDFDSLPDSVIIAEGIGINYLINVADITVTILSQTAYDSLFRGKPVVMMGYMQLKDKGCCYEVFEKNSIEDCIKKALENGYTSDQKMSFLRHVAQVLKYYVYDDCAPRQLRYGRPMPKKWDDFCFLQNLLKIVKD